MSKKKNSKIRETTGGTQVVLGELIGEGIYICEAITKNGVFICQVAEEDLK